MVLKTRVIQTLLYNTKLMVVKPKIYEHPGRSISSLMSYVRNLNSRNLDELVLIDIEATKQSRLPMFDKIKQFTSELFCPVTLGGGIALLSDIEEYLKAGADKVLINTGLQDTTLIRSAARRFGSQCIVAALDVKPWSAHFGQGSTVYRPLIKCGTEMLGERLEDFAMRLQDDGAGEILLTNVQRDGTRAGYDKALIKHVSRTVSVPVIANGGCAGLSDMLDAIKAGANAVAASSMFLFTPLTPKNCSFYLNEHGIPARVE